MRVKPEEAKDILDLLLGARGIQQGNPGSDERTLDAIAILSLPGHLRKTALSIHKKGKATATMIAELTGRKEDVEKANLIELKQMGYLEIVQLEHNILFKIRA
jgi:hypothetical protein